MTYDPSKDLEPVPASDAEVFVPLNFYWWRRQLWLNVPKDRAEEMQQRANASGIQAFTRRGGGTDGGDGGMTYDPSKDLEPVPASDAEVFVPLNFYWRRRQLWLNVPKDQAEEMQQRANAFFARIITERNT